MNGPNWRGWNHPNHKREEETQFLWWSGSVPSKEPSVMPSKAPSLEPSQFPSKLPSSVPSQEPNVAEGVGVKEEAGAKFCSAVTQQDDGKANKQEQFDSLQWPTEVHAVQGSQKTIEHQTSNKAGRRQFFKAEF